MANTRNGNTYFIDSASSNGTTSSFINQKDVLLLGLIYAADANGDTIVLADLAFTNNTYSADGAKFHINGTAKQTLYFDFSNSPIRFPNGVWVSSISANSEATLILGNK